MTDVTQILSRIEAGDRQAAETLLPLVYRELRILAAAKLAQEKPGQSLQATDLVHAAYLRLVGAEIVQDWNGRGHFFMAAAEAMRRILIERAQRRGRLKQLSGVEAGENVVTIDVRSRLAASNDTTGRRLSNSSNGIWLSLASPTRQPTRTASTTLLRQNDMSPNRELANAVEVQLLLTGNRNRAAM